jgi:NAD(P)-dependent dehydrogenase (short-subunit alcohol dehydrogenase family)
MAALRPSAGRAPYAVSKGGVVTLTQTLAEELKGTGITANAIAPSIIKTQANSESMPDADSSRWVTPEEIAELMLALCSESGRSVNGACIPVFGGV